MQYVKIFCASLLIIFFLLCGFAAADCYHNGEAYKTGDVVEGYVCTADGIWIKE